MGHHITYLASHRDAGVLSALTTVGLGSTFSVAGRVPIGPCQRIQRL